MTKLWKVALDIDINNHFVSIYLYTLGVVVHSMLVEKRLNMELAILL